MKKIYTLIALAFAAMSASADVVLTHEGNVVDPSQTLELLAEEENWGDEESPWYMIEAGHDVDVLNNGTSSASVTITVEAKEFKKFTWCGITTQCQPMSASTESRSTTLAAGESAPLRLDVSFGGGEDHGADFFGSYDATLTIKAGSKSTVYNLKYIYDERCTGINTVLAGHADDVRYDLQGRRTNSTAAGLFIKGGRKYIQK